MPVSTEDWFAAIPNRDAYAVIRGYFYQAILSVKAWVELGSAELLQLESGEDIDWVNLLNSNRAEDVNRTLGQIKYRRKRLTLYSPETLMSVFRYWQHVTHNPNLRLQFRFISNADYGAERGRKHPSGLCGIELWHSLTSPLSDDQLRDRAAYIRSLLLRAIKPADIQIVSWNGFRQSLQAFSEVELCDFLKGFSWMLRGTDVEEALAVTKSAIEARSELQHHHGAADVCLQSLLFEVLQKLSTPGPKTLTCDGCSFSLTNSITNALTSAHSGLKATYDKISRSADVFEKTVIGLHQLSDLVLNHMTGQAIQPSSGIEIAQPELILDAPPLPNRLAPRTTIVQRAMDLLKVGKPVALVGAMQSGKTTLARIISQEFQAVGWAGLKLNENITSTVVVEAAIRRTAGTDNQSPSAYRALSALSNNSIVIIDDLDFGLSQSSFAGRMSFLLQSAELANVPVLATSRTPPPSSLGSGIQALEIAGYEDGDIKALFEEYSCPSKLNEPGIRNLISAVTGGEPLLVDALIGFLSQRKWQFDDSAIDALLSKSYAPDLKREMQSRLMSFFDPLTRELLYRLALLGSSFSDNQAHEIAAINPEVPYASEKISELTGVWLQRGPEARLTVSPLISHAGEPNVSKKVKKQVHNRAASWILKKKSLTQLEVIQAIAHLLGAGEYNHAALVLLRALQVALEFDQLPSGTPLLMAWADLPLPDGIDRSFQVILRGVQVAVQTKAGMPADYALNDLRRLLAAANDAFTCLGALVACSYVSMYSWKANPSLSLEFAIQATVLERSISPELLMQTWTQSSIPELLLAVGPQLKKGEAVLTWVKAISQLSRPQQDSLLRSEMAAECIWMTFDKLWMTEQRLPEVERRWTALLNCLELCESDALSNGISLVAACAFRAQQSIRIVHLGQSADAISRAKMFIQNAQEHSVGEFLVCQGTGLWLTDVGQWDAAIEWLETASATRTKRLDILRLHNELTLAEARYRRGGDAGLCFDRAAEIIDESGLLSDIDRITTMAERATWLWLTGDMHTCFLVWESAASLLLSQSQRDRRWQHLFVLFGNQSSFCQAAAAKREIGKQVAPPTLGLFIRDIKDLSELYSDGTQWVLPAAICWFAEAVSEYDKAVEWALRAADIADQISDDPAGDFLLVAAIPGRLVERDYKAAFDYARRSALSMSRPLELKVSDAMRAANPEIAETEKNRRIAPTLRAESYAVVTGVLPALLDVIYLSIATESSAHAAAASLCETCDRIAQESENPRLWTVAREAVTAALTGSSDGSELLTIAKDDAESEETLRLLLISFGSGFGGRMTPREVYISQARWAKWVATNYQGCKTLRSFVAKKLADFWSAWIQRDGFLFRNPMHMTRRLDEVGREGSVPQVLLIAAEAVEITLPQDLRQWLSENI